MQYLFFCILYRLQEVSDVAMMQTSALQARQKSKEKEVEALKRQLLDCQVFGCCFYLLFFFLNPNKSQKG